jgi:hypothetical protein
LTPEEVVLYNSNKNKIKTMTGKSREQKPDREQAAVEVLLGMLLKIIHELQPETRPGINGVE